MATIYRYITSLLCCSVDKAFKRLYFFKVLKRSGLPNNSLMNFYNADIRPVLEYCLVICGHHLSKKQSSQLESIQERAIRIYQVTRHMPYDSLLYYCDITSLQDRRSQQAKSFFTSILDGSSCLHHLLPQQRDNVVTSRLRLASKFPVPLVRTNKFQSFLNYGLRRYQQALDWCCSCESFFLLYELPVLLQSVSKCCNVFMFMCCLNIVLFLRYSVLWPPIWNKYLLTYLHNVLTEAMPLSNSTEFQLVKVTTQKNYVWNIKILNVKIKTKSINSSSSSSSTRMRRRSSSSSSNSSKTNCNNSSKCRHAATSSTKCNQAES